MEKQGTQSIKSNLEKARADLEIARRAGDLARMSELQYGIIPNLERRYRETDSRIVREELSRYISSQACPSCHGQRLNRAARFPEFFPAPRP